MVPNTQKHWCSLFNSAWSSYYYCWDGVLLPLKDSLKYIVISLISGITPLAMPWKSWMQFCVHPQSCKLPHVYQRNRKFVSTVTKATYLAITNWQYKAYWQTTVFILFLIVLSCSQSYSLRGISLSLKIYHCWFNASLNKCSFIFFSVLRGYLLLLPLPPQEVMMRGAKFSSIYTYSSTIPMLGESYIISFRISVLIVTSYN